MIYRKPVSMSEALRHAHAKRVLALAPDIGTREIQTLIPAQISEQAFLSARTPYVDYLADTQMLIKRLVQPDALVDAAGRTTPSGVGQSISPAQVRARMKKHLARLGYEPDPKKRGGLQDLSSDRRINLIINMQTKSARGYAWERQSQDPTVLNLWPAEELYRALARTVHRKWQARWNAARRALGSRTTATKATEPTGPFVAKKNDQIWARISSFSRPYPPFDFGSGMRKRDVTRDQAVRLEVVTDQETVPPVADPMGQHIEMPAGDTPEPLLSVILQAFGDRASLQDGTLHVIPDRNVTIQTLAHRAAAGKSAQAPVAFVPPQRQAALAQALDRDSVPAGTTIDLDADTMRDMAAATPGDAQAVIGDVSTARFRPGPNPGEVVLDTGADYGMVARFDADRKRLLVQAWHELREP